MDTINLNTRPLNTLSGYEATTRLSQVLKQAYFRRSKQLPGNLNDIVETLKGDVLRLMPAVTIDQIDEAVTDWVLNQIDKPISPAFFFAAIRAHYVGPRRTREMDRDICPRPDTEEDFLALMDTLAAFIDHRPIFFKACREYGNLKDRGQLAPDAWKRYAEKAVVKINSQRLKDGKVKKMQLDMEDEELQDVAKRMAVEDWLRSCVTANTTPSKILKKTIMK